MVPKPIGLGVDPDKLHKQQQFFLIYFLLLIFISIVKNIFTQDHATIVPYSVIVGIPLDNLRCQTECIIIVFFFVHFGSTLFNQCVVFFNFGCFF
ncbi:uncharacterized protein B0P05DRAFT_541621 [Gilbertella persicaria]|uniref:uncharacterized protein n=1 Tax=Gilbertella persicaria TaxID=101096 RepID=UPI00221ED464|nr:uncharacterized protein B0P05DRAFT_541621 [Gilbertella persicaria]KAI8079693.1 hypothetical protein B0P05DRAFT_541621 [Gilbertella persicaria]